TQNLESYFLDVVQKARQAAEETSGATSGHKVADYLRGDAEGKPATDKILERLTSSQATSTAPVISSVPQPLEAVDTKKLEALTLPKEPTPQTPAPAKVDVEKT